MSSRAIAPYPPSRRELTLDDNSSTNAGIDGQPFDHQLAAKAD